MRLATINRGETLWIASGKPTRCSWLKDKVFWIKIHPDFVPIGFNDVIQIRESGFGKDEKPIRLPAKEGNEIVKRVSSLREVLPFRVSLQTPPDFREDRANQGE